MPSFRPMKGEHAPEDLSLLRYPLIASEKIDGWRCLVAPIDWARRTIPCDPKHQHYFDAAQHCIALSASNKPISNYYVQCQLDRPELGGCDGELIASAAFNETSSAFATQGGEPAFAYHIFDRFDRPNDPFEMRLQQLELLHLPSVSNVEFFKHPQHKVHSLQMLDELVGLLLDEGAEGAIVRDPAGLYKYGRATVRQQWMLKIKQFHDAEAVVIGYEEFMHNENEPEVSQLGLTRRSHHQAGKVPGGKLGALVCMPLDKYDSVCGCDYPGAAAYIFKIGTGFDDATRQLLWAQREANCGRIVKYKSMSHGVLEAPRHPVFLGFRAEDFNND